MENQLYRQSSVKLVINIIIDTILMFIFIGWILLPIHILDYLRRTLTITKNGLILKKGILTMHITEMPYSKINSVSVRRGLLGNIFGYGDIIILAGNDTGGIPFKGVEDPEGLKANILRYVHGDNITSPTESTPTQNNSYSELENLASLKEKGIITQHEFDQKKKQLLGI